MVNIFVSGVNLKFKIDTGDDITVVPNNILGLLNDVNTMPLRQILMCSRCDTLNVERKFFAKLETEDRCSQQDIHVVKNIAESLLY